MRPGDRPGLIDRLPGQGPPSGLPFRRPKSVIGPQLASLVTPLCTDLLASWPHSPACARPNRLSRSQKRRQRTAQADSLTALLSPDGGRSIVHSEQRRPFIRLTRAVNPLNGRVELAGMEEFDG